MVNRKRILFVVNAQEEVSSDPTLHWSKKSIVAFLTFVIFFVLAAVGSV